MRARRLRAERVVVVRERERRAGEGEREALEAVGE